MTDDERDEFRRLLVAFEDAATWCEQLTSLTRELIGAMQHKRSIAQARLLEELERVEGTLRHLEADRREVDALRRRVGVTDAGKRTE
jgi:hypothetical protein